MKKYKKMQERLDACQRKYDSELNKLSDVTEEAYKVSESIDKDIKNVNIIIEDINKNFSEKTGIINRKDMIFLWTAVAVQCVRWILIPTFDIETLTPDKDNRKDSGSEGKKDKSASGDEIDKMKDEDPNMDSKLPDRDKIMQLKVPYDAMKGTEDIVIPGVTPFGKCISGKNHHSATYGHDPIIGQVVGTANILTRSITFTDKFITTRKVVIPSGGDQVVVKFPVYGIPQMISDVIKSAKEDKGRIGYAVLKENLHLQSDKYTKYGLPIPFLSPELKQKLLRMGWNSKELEDVVKGAIKGIEMNFFVALIINSIVGSLHGFCYEESSDGDPRLYSVRTRKVVATSNIIAEGINLAAVATGTIAGVISENPDLIKKSICHLDIGGMVEAIHQVACSGSLQEKIRREFLEQELYNRFTLGRYSFLEESYYE